MKHLLERIFGKLYSMRDYTPAPEYTLAEWLAKLRAEILWHKQLPTQGGLLRSYKGNHIE